MPKHTPPPSFHTHFPHPHPKSWQDRITPPTGPFGHNGFSPTSPPPPTGRGALEGRGRGFPRLRHQLLGGLEPCLHGQVLARVNGLACPVDFPVAVLGQVISDRYV